MPSSKIKTQRSSSSKNRFGREKGSDGLRSKSSMQLRQRNKSKTNISQEPGEIMLSQEQIKQITNRITKNLFEILICPKHQMMSFKIKSDSSCCLSQYIVQTMAKIQTERVMTQEPKTQQRIMVHKNKTPRSQTPQALIQGLSASWLDIKKLKSPIKIMASDDQNMMNFHNVLCQIAEKKQTRKTGDNKLQSKSNQQKSKSSGSKKKSMKLFKNEQKNGSSRIKIKEHDKIPKSINKKSKLVQQKSNEIIKNITLIDNSKVILNNPVPPKIVRKSSDGKIPFVPIKVRAPIEIYAKVEDIKPKYKLDQQQSTESSKVKAEPNLLIESKISVDYLNQLSSESASKIKLDFYKFEPKYTDSSKAIQLQHSNAQTENLVSKMIKNGNFLQEKPQDQLINDDNHKIMGHYPVTKGFPSALVLPSTERLVDTKTKTIPKYPIHLSLSKSVPQSDSLQINPFTPDLATPDFFCIKQKELNYQLEKVEVPLLQQKSSNKLTIGHHYLETEKQSSTLEVGQQPMLPSKYQSHYDGQKQSDFAQSLRYPPLDWKGNPVPQQRQPTTDIMQSYRQLDYPKNAQCSSMSSVLIESFSYPKQQQQQSSSPPLLSTNVDALNPKI